MKLPNFIEESSGKYVLSQAVTETEIINAGLLILQERINKNELMKCPDTVKEYLTLYFSGHGHESFVCLFLDNKHRLIACEEMFKGTISGASVHPREIVKRVLELNAAAVIFSHNHPSGNARKNSHENFKHRNH
jgi:DNA repair protein RadC